jgi:hypothetical protein
MIDGTLFMGYYCSCYARYRAGSGSEALFQVRKDGLSIPRLSLSTYASLLGIVITS